jgi:hypothetical protein
MSLWVANETEHISNSTRDDIHQLRHNIVTSLAFLALSLSRASLEIHTCRINMKFESISFRTHWLHIINCRNGVHARPGSFGTFHYICTGR